ncbi:fibrinogen alpha chain [Clinocottus analis]|uniref:fibrinogen alpha chain n=1 Tax=Clinocottus analis TaxID=304258 RepID=UPI0035C068D8
MRHKHYRIRFCSRPTQWIQDGRQPAGHDPAPGGRRCGATASVPLCSDDDWVSKCPSGCRLQGLISQAEREVERKLRKVCTRAKLYQDAAAKSTSAMTQIYSHNRRVLANRHQSELKFLERAEGLTRNLTALRRRTSRLSLRLEELSASVQKQMEDVYRTEVDVDMKLRACSGSCRSALPFSVDHLGYRALMDEVEQVELSQRRKAAPPPSDVPGVRLQPVDRSRPAVQREMLNRFEDVEQNRVVLEVLHPDS